MNDRLWKSCGIEEGKEKMCYLYYELRRNNSQREQMEKRGNKLELMIVID